jgi:hypothetical protein
MEMTMAKYRRRRNNPLQFTAGSVGMIALVAGAAFGAYLFWKWWQGNKQKLMPQSAAEKQVNALYGPGQAWKTNPVYNTPGSANYIPNLPASYAPGTPASAMTVPPGTIQGSNAASSSGAKISQWFAGKSIGSDPFNTSVQTGAGTATSAPLTTDSMPLFGVDDVEAVDDVIGENVTRFRKR